MANVLFSTAYNATTIKTNGQILPNTADRRAYLYTHPSIAMVHACDPDGMQVSVRIYNNAVYLVELQSSDAQLGNQGFNALRKTVFLYEFVYRTEFKDIQEGGIISSYDCPRGLYTGSHNAFDYIGADPQVVKMVTLEDRQSGAFDFLFRPSGADRAVANNFTFDFYSSFFL